MSMIERLSIQGIRSFNPNEPSDIRFQSPLTVIVGHNGAGKTTIIECLKYVTTGELPPNSKAGAAFVYDPKLAREREVKAQVKLKFTNASGKSMICSRRLQVTQTAKKSTLKTLESALLTVDPKTGERQSISSKCADMDRLIPIELGVSKPVLENVIFCHQEESNWPLSEGKKLKEKFDDIFAATRYIKALDNIKKFRDEQQKDIREKSIELEHLEKCKEAAGEKRKELETIRAKIAATEATIADINEKLKPINKRMAGLDETLAKFHALTSKRAVAESAKQQLSKSIREIRSSLAKELQESDKELEQMSARFADQVAQIQSKLERLQSSQSQGVHRLESLRLKYNKSLTENGRLTAEAGTLRSKAQERDALVGRLHAKFRPQLGELGGFDAQSLALEREASGEAFRRLYDKIIAQRLEEIQRDTLAVKAKEEQADAEVEARRSDVTTLSAQLKSKDRELQLKKAAAAQVQRQAASTVGTSESLVELEEAVRRDQSTLRELEHTFTQLSAEAESQLLKAKIARKQEQVASTKQRFDALEKEYELINTELGARAQLELKKQQLSSKRAERMSILQRRGRDVQRMLPDVGPGFASAVSETPSAAETELLSSRFAKHLSSLNSSSTAEQVALSGVEASLAAARSQQELLKTEEQRYLGEMRTIRAAVAAVLSEENTEESEDDDVSVTGGTASTSARGETRSSLDQVLAGVEGALAEARRTLATLDSAALMYGKFVEKASKSHACPLCEQSFGPHGKNERSFIDSLSKKLSSIPEKRVELETQISEYETKQKALVALQPRWVRLKDLETSVLPKLRTDIRKAAGSITDLLAEQDRLTTAVAELRSSVEAASLVQPDIATYVRVCAEIRTLEQEIQAQERSLLSGGTSRTPEQVSSERKQAQADLDKAHRELAAATEEHSSKKSEAMAVSSQTHSVKSVITGRQAKIDAGRKLYEQLDQLNGEVRAIQDDIQRMQQQQQPLEARLQSALNQRERVKAELKELDGKARDETSILQHDMDQLKTLNRDVSKLASKEQELQASVTLRGDLSFEMKAIEAELENNKSESSKLAQQLDHEQSLKRNLADNISLRKKQAEVEGLDKQMASIGEDLKRLNVGDVDGEKQSVRTKQQDLENERAKSEGQRTTLLEQDKAINRELQKELFKDVDERYRKQLIAVKTAKVANQDLEKYYKALDKAVMKYHSLKMSEINEIIKELWSNTYKGADIDAIEIRSDVDEEETQTSGRKSYNYRVVMLKDGMEMDIRGRCSAGQKVLACLIIRMALSETFCLNCGILALDEPTTNLDRENIDGLAHALTKLVEARSQQRNFQLIVITHDEEFVSMLGKSECVDRYFRVEKDNNQYSKIIVESFVGTISQSG